MPQPRFFALSAVLRSRTGALHTSTGYRVSELSTEAMLGGFVLKLAKDYPAYDLHGAPCIIEVTPEELASYGYKLVPIGEPAAPPSTHEPDASEIVGPYIYNVLKQFMNQHRMGGQAIYADSDGRALLKRVMSLVDQAEACQQAGVTVFAPED